MRFLSAPLIPCSFAICDSVLEGISAGVLSLGVWAVDVAALPVSSSSPSSSPKDSLPLATVFRFFFFGNSFGAELLCFDHQRLHLNPVHLIVPAFPINLPVTHGSRSRGCSIGSCICETTELFLLERIGATFAEIV